MWRSALVVIAMGGVALADVDLTGKADKITATLETPGVRRAVFRPNWGGPLDACAQRIFKAMSFPAGAYTFIVPITFKPS